MKIIRYFSRGLACLMAALLILGLFPGAPAQAAEEFIALYEAEKDSFVGYMAVGDGHYTANTSEYFAQIFCQLLVAPDTASSAPGSFAFVERCLRG